MSDAGTSIRPPLVTGDKSIGDVTNDICAPMDCRPSALWWVAFLLSLVALGIGVVAVWYQIATGIGTWGLNKTVGWAFDITNFVFWVGIGHAGTLISAVLFLFRQKWRTAVNRSAEAMTLFAVMAVMAIFAIGLLAIAPSIQLEVQREKELESIRRGEEVAEAIRQYVEFYRGARLPTLSLQDRGRETCPLRAWRDRAAARVTGRAQLACECDSCVAGRSRWRSPNWLAARVVGDVRRSRGRACRLVDQRHGAVRNCGHRHDGRICGDRVVLAANSHGL